MRNYQTARSLFSFLEFLAWAMVVIGVLVAIALMQTVPPYAPGISKLVATLPGLGVSFVGILSAAMVQNWRAGVDSAEYGQQMLQIARDQLEISRQALKQNQTKTESFAAVAEGKSVGKTEPPVTSFADAPRAPEENTEGDQAQTKTIKYKGSMITEDNGQFFYGKMAFSSLEKAQRHIDQLGVNPNAKLDGVTRS